MSIHCTTPVPNVVLDEWLFHLKYAELKVLLLIIRQTYGWIDPKNPRKRKEFDRLTINTFVKRTNCSRRSITDAIDSLIKHGILEVLDYDGNLVLSPQSRKGKAILYYHPKIQPVRKLPYSSAKSALKPMQNLRISKETVKKEEIKGFYPSRNSGFKHISSTLKQYQL